MDTTTKINALTSTIASSTKEYKALNDKFKSLKANGDITPEQRAKIEGDLASLKTNIDTQKEELNKLTVNNALIASLSKKMQAIETEYNIYPKAIGIPSSKAQNGTLVLSKDLMEYNGLLKMVNLLKEGLNTKDATLVWNTAYVPAEKIIELKELIITLAFFDDKIPKIKENKTRMVEIMQQIKKLTPADKEAYGALTNMYYLLLASNPLDSENLIETEGVKLDESYVAIYQKSLKTANSKANLKPPKKKNYLEEIEDSFKIPFLVEDSEHSRQVGARLDNIMGIDTLDESPQNLQI